RSQKAGVKKQQQLVFKTTTGPLKFTREGTLHAVVALTATNNQVIASFQQLLITHFCNVLISIKPKSTLLDLPNTHSVKVYLHNEFVRHMRDLKAQITVSFSFQIINRS
ncbi:hypothetical protein B0H34DRAFT_663562, partial [Crassisporium funariophilum]